MSASNAAANLAASANTLAAGAVFSVMGMPLSLLVACLLAAGLSHVVAKNVPDDKIPVRMLGILFDALIGGWAALLLVNWTYMQKHGIDAMPLQAVGGLLALSCRAGRALLAAKIDKALDALIARFIGPSRAAAPAAPAIDEEPQA